MRAHLARKRVRRVREIAALHAEQLRKKREQETENERIKQLERQTHERKEQERLQLEMEIRKAEAQAAAEQRIAVQAEQARAEAMARQAQIHADLSSKKQELDDLRNSVETERRQRQQAELEANQFRQAQEVNEKEIIHLRQTAEQIAAAKITLESTLEVLQRERLESHVRHSEVLSQNHELLEKNRLEAASVARKIVQQELERTELVRLTEQLQVSQERHQLELAQEREMTRDRQQHLEQQLREEKEARSRITADYTQVQSQLVALQFAVHKTLAMKQATEEELQQERLTRLAREQQLGSETEEILKEAEMQLQRTRVDLQNREQRLVHLGEVLASTETQKANLAQALLEEQRDRLASRAYNYRQMNQSLSETEKALHATRLTIKQQELELANLKLLLDTVQRERLAKEVEAERERLEHKDSRQTHSHEQERNFNFVLQLSEAKGKAEAEALSAHTQMEDLKARQQQELAAARRELDQARQQAAAEISRLDTALQASVSLVHQQDAENKALADMITASRNERRAFEQEVKTLQAEMGTVRTRLETSAQDQKAAQAESQIMQKRRRDEALEELRARVGLTVLFLWPVPFDILSIHGDHPPCLCSIFWRIFVCSFVLFLPAISLLVDLQLI